MSPKTAPPSPEPVSEEYPKWLRKPGARDILVRSLAEETAQRENGFSHEVIVAEQQPPLGSVAPTPIKGAAPAAAAAPAGGTVATAVLDSMLEAQRTRFDASWNRKCDDMRELQAKYDALKKDYDALLSEVLAAKPAPTPIDAPPAEVVTPVKPPVANKPAKG